MTITGTNFTGVTQVDFGSIEARGVVHRRIEFVDHRHGACAGGRRRGHHRDHVRGHLGRQRGGSLHLSGPQPCYVPVHDNTTTQGTWMGTYGGQGYDVIDGSSSLPSYASDHPGGREQLRLGAVDDRPPRPADLGRLEPDRRDLVDDDELRGRREPHRRPGARPGAVLPRLGPAGADRAGADQRREHRCGAEHADDLVVPVGRVPGLRGEREHRDHDHQGGGDEQRPQRPVPRPGVLVHPGPDRQPVHLFAERPVPTDHAGRRQPRRIRPGRPGHLGRGDQRQPGRLCDHAGRRQPRRLQLRRQGAVGLRHEWESRRLPSSSRTMAMP